MLLENELFPYIESNFKETIIEQFQHHKEPKSRLSFFVSIDFFDVIKTKPKIASLIVGNYPLFIQVLEKAIRDILSNGYSLSPHNFVKASIYFENCIIPKHNIKSVEFMTASLNQKDGTLVYFKDAEVLSIKESELYLQSWTEIWQYVCECKLSPNQSKKLYKKKNSQSLLDIVTKAKNNNFKENYKSLELIECDDCRMSLRFLGRDEFIYEHCQIVEVMIDEGQFESQYVSGGNLSILIDKDNGDKLKKGDLFDGCCYLKSSVELVKSFANQRVSAEISNLIYLVCAYPQNNYLTPANNEFFANLISLSLDQKPITKLTSVFDIVDNYKNFIKTINEIRYPYLGENYLTALKLITISSIFSQQINQEKLNLLIITDEVSMMIKFLHINGLSIKKFPTIYDERTISNFFNSCHNSIILISNPDKKEFALINKILKGEAYGNLNIVLWIICEPEENLKKKLEINEIQIILDLTVEKNLNVCESVYVSMIDDYLDCFLLEEEDEFVATIAKKFNKRMIFDEDSKKSNIFFNITTENEIIKEERLANDLLKRYFLKAREYKTTKLATMENLTKIAESFAQFRYFLTNKTFSQNNDSKENTLRLSVLDVILAIFIDEETSRNKFSASNTLFADEVSKVMLNENSSSVGIWDYEVDNNYVQETRKYIPKNELVGMVITKIFDLVYERD